jgi:Serine incorporator (Serinc)
MAGIGLSIIYQYGLSRLMLDDRLPSQLFLRGYWLDDCTAAYGAMDADVAKAAAVAQNTTTTSNVDNIIDDSFVRGCVEQQANYRVAAATTLFFILAGLAALCKPTANREAWPAKFTLYLFLVIVTIFIPAQFWLNDVYLNVARGTFFFRANRKKQQPNHLSHTQHTTTKQQQPVAHYLSFFNNWSLLTYRIIGMKVGWKNPIRPTGTKDPERDKNG